MSFEITPYSETHFASVKALWEEVFPDDPPRDDADISIAAKTKEHPELFLLALEGERVVGSVMAGYDGHRGWLYRVAVAKAHRHLGAVLRRGALADQHTGHRYHGGPCGGEADHARAGSRLGIHFHSFGLVEPGASPPYTSARVNEPLPSGSNIDEFARLRRPLLDESEPRLGF